MHRYKYMEHVHVLCTTELHVMMLKMWWNQSLTTKCCIFPTLANGLINIRFIKEEAAFSSPQFNLYINHQWIPYVLYANDGL